MNFVFHLSPASSNAEFSRTFYSPYSNQNQILMLLCRSSKQHQLFQYHSRLLRLIFTVQYISRRYIFIFLFDRNTAEEMTQKRYFQPRILKSNKRTAHFQIPAALFQYPHRDLPRQACKWQS